MIGLTAAAVCLLSFAAAEIQLPTTWEVIGPFAWGMRELGGDPLWAYLPDGGLGGVPFPWPEGTPLASELVDGGLLLADGGAPLVVETQPDGSVSVVFGGDVRWEFNREFFGWAANQWQAWARGAFTVSAEDAGRPHLLRCQSVGEFWVDRQGEQPPQLHTGAHGDWYAYGELWHRLEGMDEGEYTLRVRLAAEMRLFGGQLPPPVTFKCEISAMSPDVGAIARVLHNQRILPEVDSSNDSTLFTPYASVGIVNSHDGDIYIVGIGNNNGSGSGLAAELLLAEGQRTSGIRIASGQSRRVPFLVSRVPGSSGSNLLSIFFVIRTAGETTVQLPLDPIELVSRLPALGEAFALTFVDYDGSVQYTMVKRPQSPCPSEVEDDCPAIVTLHGAGVEASSGSWTDAYPTQPFAWIVYPTGRTPWGYDWHGASRLNVEYALQAAASYAGPGQIDITRIFISGHSNGGQGCWYMSSHYADRYVAANPAAGYMKIQFYVPFYWRPGDAHADPVLRALLESSIAEFDTDLYTPNLVGLPLIARTGADDDNVPPVNSRRLIRLLNELNGKGGVPALSEVEGGGHWFDGIMTSGDVGDFLAGHTMMHTPLPPFPESYTVVTLNPASSGARGGLVIQQLRIPARAGRLHVVQQRAQGQLIIKTENVRRFGMTTDNRTTSTELVIDGTVLPAVRLPEQQYCRLNSPSDPWAICPDSCSWCASERSSSSSGPILQVYDRQLLLVVGTHGTVQETARCKAGAVTIANDWLQFGNGVVDIIADDEALDRADLAAFNLIVLGGPAVNSFSASEASTGNLPVSFEADGRWFSIGWRLFNDPGTGVLFTAPWKGNLAVIASGIDEEGLRLAIEQFPVRTGTTVPDYIVVNPEQQWKAAGGVLAAGFWSYDWSFSEVSGYLR